MNERHPYFLFITDIRTPVWQPVLTEALLAWGALEAVAEMEVGARLRQAAACPQLDVRFVVLLDASQCQDAVGLVKSLHAEFPAVPLVVLTALSDLRLLRSVYKAGARDCLKMSLDARALRQLFTPVLAQILATD